jgi:peptide/nickel transport system substrate-binding protein
MVRAKTILALASLFLLVGMLAAQCPPAGTPVETPSQLIIGTTDKVTDLDPANSYDFHTWEIHHNTADTLLVYKAGTTDLMPGLAEAMPSISSDGLEYTFKLRPNLKFGDGTPCNAEAVKWSIDRVARLEGDPNWLVTSFVKEVTVVDDLTVKFVLLDTIPYFPLLVATQPYTPLSAKSYSADQFDPDNTSGGVGAYKITKWERDIELVLDANPDYYGTPPKTSKVIVKYFKDATTMRLAVEKGDIDVAWKTLLPTDYVDLKKNDKLNVIEGPGAYIRYLCFNCTTAPFDNAKVRQAISLAVNRDNVCTKVFQGTHTPLYSMVPMGMWSHTDSFPKRDLDQAKTLLGEAGYSADKKLVMDLWYSPTHYGDTEADVAALLKADLEETGVIQVTLQNTEWATYKEYQNAGSMPVFLLGWYPDYLDPDNYTSPFGESGASDDMGIFYGNQAMDDLLVKGRSEAELRGEARKKIYEDLQTLWTTEVPTCPLFQGALLVVTQANVDGIMLDPSMFLHYYTIYKK